MLSIIEEGNNALEHSSKVITWVLDGNTTGPRGEKLHLMKDEAKLCAPLPSLKSRIMMAGSNFWDHARDGLNVRSEKQYTISDVKELVEKGEKRPWGFWKHGQNVVGPDEPIFYPARTERLDYECELVAIIGRSCKDVTEEEALSYVYGRTIINDMSCRDHPSDVGLWVEKNFDGSAPMGLCIVTADEIQDPYNLRIMQTVNGEIRQDGNTSDMIWDYSYWISWLSRDLTLRPGDMISGGTCSGTAMDQTPRQSGTTDPKLFLKPGDKLEASIEKLGTLRNHVVAK
jgi:2-keto-4-pentenoate hydratase/2-oxohepta-3-ene-1,7-dioic acid hydratase in catechol pathway